MELRSTLVEVLAEHTATPERCWFCIWEGWGGFTPPPGHTVRVSLPGRKYVLVAASVTAELGEFRRLSRPGPSLAVMTLSRGGESREPNWDEFPFRDDGASIWWPDDRQWCVATEIDFMWNYVGGSKACIDALFARPDLEALPAELDHDLRDPINPHP